MPFWPDAADLATHLGVDDVADEDRAELAVVLAAGALVSHSGQDFEAMADDTHVVVDLDHGRDHHGGSVWLPQRPVTAVSDVDVDGTTLDEDLWVADPRLGRVLLRPRVWRGDVLTVTYDHGYAEIPAGLKLLHLRVATRVYKNPLGKISDAEGPDTQTNYGRTNGADIEVPVLSAGEKALLRPFMPPLVG